VDEKEWLECADPQKMLKFLRGKASERKLRLFGVACCRHKRLMREGPYKRALDFAEQFADGLGTLHDLRVVRRELQEERDYSLAALSAVSKDNPLILRVTTYAMEEAANAALLEARVDAWDKGFSVEETHKAGEDAKKNVSRELAIFQTCLVREIFGNPFHSTTVQPTWLTPTVKALAQAIYTERTFTDLPVLADALEEAGCMDHDILNHCRHPGDHVLGCWVVDLLLGKV
jgi:hypothetical protein